MSYVESAWLCEVSQLTNVAEERQSNHILLEARYTAYWCDQQTPINMEQIDMILPNQSIQIGRRKEKSLSSNFRDPEVQQWMLNQPSLAARNPQFVQYNINNHPVASETPEHNRMQIQFLKVEIRRKTYSLFGQELIGRSLVLVVLVDLAQKLEYEAKLVIGFAVEVGDEKFEPIDVVFDGRAALEIRSNKPDTGKYLQQSDTSYSLFPRNPDNYVEEFPYFEVDPDRWTIFWWN